MTDVFALRAELDRVRLARDTAQALVSDSDVAFQRLQAWFDAGAVAPPHGQDPRVMVEQAKSAAGERKDVLAALTAELTEVRQRLTAHLDRERSLFGGPTDDVVALLPVRIETSFQTPRRLRVRVYPDDLHIDALDPAVTERELEAGRRFWRRGGDEKAWARLLDELSPRRAAWVAHATRDGATPEVRSRGRRQPRVTTLPSAWRFIGITDGRIAVQTRGKPVPTPLPLGLLEPDEQGAEDHATWLVDFRAAVAVGMAAVLTLPAGIDHLDQLFVVGVQDSERRQATERLHATLRSHAFTSGLAFLEPGTPTNNTPGSRTEWSSKPRRSLPRPRPPELHEDTDARRLAKALGFIAGDFLAHCPGGNRSVDTAVRAMTMIGWSALTQEFVRDAVSKQPFAAHPFQAGDAATFLPIRRHAVAQVRSRGVMPTIRIGAQPYGVLAASSPDEWRPAPEHSAEVLILPWLLKLRNHWRAALVPGWIPRVSDGRPADRTAVEALVRLPVAKDLVIRRVAATDEAIGKFNLRIPPSAGPVLSVGGIAFNSGLRWATPTELASNVAWTGPNTPPDYSKLRPRLSNPKRDAEVVRRSAEKYGEMLAVLDRELDPRTYLRKWYRVEPGLVESKSLTIFETLEDQSFVLDVLSVNNWQAPGPDDSPADDLAGALNLPLDMDNMMFLIEQGVSGGPVERERRAMLRWRERAGVVHEHLQHLAAVPEGELVPLLLEVVDVLSHRWDAWATSLPSRRIFEMRDAGRTGVRLGGYGWAENLRPAGPRERVAPNVFASRGDGYIHAPSLHHAATGAVLRSGYLGHGRQSLAVDLSSRRVRVARWVLAGVRRGQDLGSLLGYRLERALHDHHKDHLIDDFREIFGAVSVPPEGMEAQDPTWRRSHEAIEAKNVVDGLKMARDPARVHAHIQAMGIVGDTVLARLVDDLADVLDAVGDLVLAESVHQLVGGNPMRAGIAADTLGRGQQVPDRFEMVRTPRRGRAVTHRLLTVLPARPGRANGWGRDVLSDLDPRLDAWVGHLLGPARQWRLSGTVRSDGEVLDTFDTTVDELGISALGLVLTWDQPGGRMHRLLRRDAGQSEGAVHLEMGHAHLGSVVAAVRSLLASSQPLRPDQLGGSGVRVDLQELQGRVQGFLTALEDAALRRELGIAGGLPGLRVATARDLETADWLPVVAQALAEVLGAAVPLSPILRGVDLPKGRGDVSALMVEEWLRRYGAVRPTVRTWHDLVALDAVRRRANPALAVSQLPPAGDWIGGPFGETERPPAREHWVRHEPAGRPDGGLVGYVSDEWPEVIPGSDALARTKRGRRAVPVASELTGVSFHFDRPDAKAPQALLVAVPPDSRRGWTPDTLALVVRDTLELAKLRAVDLADLPLLDDLLPAARLARRSSAGGTAFRLWRDLS